MVSDGPSHGRYLVMVAPDKTLETSGRADAKAETKWGSRLIAICTLLSV